MIYLTDHISCSEICALRKQRETAFIIYTGSMESHAVVQAIADNKSEAYSYIRSHVGEGLKAAPFDVFCR